MAKKPQNTEDSVKEQSSEASKNLLNSLLNGYEGEHFSNFKSLNRIIPTGSLILDSLVKVRSGSIIRLAGKGSELGKTSQSLVLANNFMETMPKSKTLYIKAEGRLGEEIQKRSGLKFVFDPKEWEYGTVYVLPTNIFEVVAQIIESLLKTMSEQGEYLCIILDSMDGLMLRETSEKNLWNGKESPKVAGVPLLSKLLFRKISIPVFYYDALFLITSQYSAEIKLDPYSPNVPRQVEGSGGSAINHQCDQVWSYAPRFQGDMILKNPDEKPDHVKNPIIGLYATIEIKKSSTDVTGAKVKIPIKKGVIGCAIWKSKEVGDMILAWALAKRAGAWITFEESIVSEAKGNNIELAPKIQGMNALYDYLESNVEVCNWFENKIRSILP